MRRRVRAIAGAVMLLVVAGGCSSRGSDDGTGGPLDVGQGGANRAGEQHDRQHVRTARTVELTPVCIRHGSPGGIIVSVTALKTQGPIDIVRWGIAPTPTARPLMQTRAVTERCGPKVDQSLVTIVELTAARPARIIEFVVTYRSQGRQWSGTIPYVVTLCPAKCPRRWVVDDPFGRKVVP
jgi:hypothetical protein